MEKKNPKFYIQVHNISKRHNIESLIKNACAFGVKKFFFINKTDDQIKKSKFLNKFNVIKDRNGDDWRVDDYQIFPTVEKAKEYFIENNINVCGIGNPLYNLYILWNYNFENKRYMKQAEMFQSTLLKGILCLYLGMRSQAFSHS